MISRTTQLTATQRATIGRLALSRSTETNEQPSDSVNITPIAKHREPTEAVAFMERFDRQLGLSEAATAEKRALMSESSHTFFRASPALFFHDLQTQYAQSSRLLPTAAPMVAILGDCHAGNAGTFRGPDGKAVWGLNDFDQAEVGSPEWDLERLGVSLYVGSRANDTSPEDAMALVQKMGKAYLSALDEKGPAYLEQSETTGVIASLIEKAGSKEHKKFLKKWTTDDTQKLVRGGKLEDVEPKRGKQITDALEKTFPDYTFLDTAAKPGSGGSTRGLERYYSLVRSADRPDPWILETKVVLPSPVHVPDGDLSRGNGDNLIDFWKRMGGSVDDRNRAFRIDNIAFFTREREAEKDALEDKQHELDASAEGIGRLLARAHTRSGADLKGWIGDQQDTLLQNLAEFSRNYARQVESDFREWKHRYGSDAV